MEPPVHRAGDQCPGPVAGQDEKQQLLEAQPKHVQETLLRNRIVPRREISRRACFSGELLRSPKLLLSALRRETWDSPGGASLASPVNPRSPVFSVNKVATLSVTFGKKNGGEGIDGGKGGKPGEEAQRSLFGFKECDRPSHLNPTKVLCPVGGTGRKVGPPAIDRVHLATFVH